MNLKARKYFIRSLILSLSLLLVGCGNAPKEQERFDQFTLSEFKERVSSDTMTLHFTLADPTIYEIHSVKQTLGNISKEEDQKQLLHLQDSYNELLSFRYYKLTESQQRDFDIYEYALKNELLLSQNQEFDYLFSPDGLTSILPTNFIEYQFYSEKDVENYLFLLTDMERYLHEALRYSDEQAATGYFLSDFVLDKTIQQCNDFTVNKENHPFFHSFTEKINRLSIDENKKNQYILANEMIVNETIFPLFEEVASHLETLKGSSVIQKEGLYAYPNGKEYYATLFKAKTGLNNTPQEVFSQLNDEMMNVIAATSNLANANPTLQVDLQQSYSRLFSEPVDILNHLNKAIQSDFPTVLDVEYSIEYLDEALINENVLAYFMPPPIDNIMKNAIKVNGVSIKEDLLQLYSTLAHEGYPGHLYQNTYFMSSHPTPLRSTLNFLGYIEGWAKSIESDAYNYIGFDNDVIKQYMQLNSNYGYYLQSACDIGVNYLGWSRSDLEKYLSEYGITDSISIQNLYESVIMHPAVILPYGVGAMKMNALKRNAQIRLKEDFDLKEFYQVILDSGPVPFNLLEKDVNDYIKEKLDKS